MNGDGKISKEEFVTFWEVVKGSGHAEDEIMDDWYNRLLLERSHTYNNRRILPNIHMDKNSWLIDIYYNIINTVVSFFKISDKMICSLIRI